MSHLLIFTYSAYHVVAECETSAAPLRGIRLLKYDLFDLPFVVEYPIR